MKICIVDNGSLKAEATLSLRRIAQQLSEASGQPVDAVSLQHAHKIAAEQLQGEPAQVLIDYCRAQLQAGEREFLLIPLFFGLSRALTSFIPEQQAILQQEFGEFELRLADTLFPLPDGDPRLAQILFEHIQQTGQQHAVSMNNLVLVDHGSPAPQVTAVREKISQQLAALLGEDANLEQAVMERRKGRQYDFNGQLLEDWLRQSADTGVKSAIVSMLFLQPGRHAGEGGDIEQICDAVMQEYPGFEVAITPLVGEPPLLISILKSRLEAQLAAA